MKPVPKAAILPLKVRVSANPIEKAPTNTNPKLILLRCKHIKKTVIAAGHGIRPPEKPNNIVCHIPIRPEDRRFLFHWRVLVHGHQALLDHCYRDGGDGLNAVQIKVGSKILKKRDSKDNKT